MVLYSIDSLLLLACSCNANSGHRDELQDRWADILLVSYGQGSVVWIATFCHSSQIVGHNIMSFSHHSTSMIAVTLLTTPSFHHASRMASSLHFFPLGPLRMSSTGQKPRAKKPSPNSVDFYGDLSDLGDGTGSSCDECHKHRKEYTSPSSYMPVEDCRRARVWSGPKNRINRSHLVLALDKALGRGAYKLQNRSEGEFAVYCENPAVAAEFRLAKVVVDGERLEVDVFSHCHKVEGEWDFDPVKPEDDPYGIFQPPEPTVICLRAPPHSSSERLDLAVRKELQKILAPTPHSVVRREKDYIVTIQKPSSGILFYGRGPLRVNGIAYKQILMSGPFSPTVYTDAFDYPDPGPASSDSDDDSGNDEMDEADKKVDTSSKARNKMPRRSSRRQSESAYTCVLL